MAKGGKTVSKAAVPKAPSSKSAKAKETIVKDVVKKDKKKGSKKRKESYGIYIFKVLRQVHPDTGKNFINYIN